MHEKSKISNRLKMWYLKNGRDLPWRKSNHPYPVWLSEIILQQTQIAQGTSYFLKFLTHFPTINHLANASEDQVLHLWQGLGYYSRARHLHHTAKVIHQDYAGEFPTSYKDLKQLKGVGDYTASAIASICYGLPHAVVDGNVYRVLSRLFNLNTPINSTQGIKTFKVLAQSLLDRNDPGTHNQAMMDFGAMICKPKNPSCQTCIFNDLCLALKHQTIGERPVKDKRIKIKDRFFNFLVFETANNSTVIEQRVEKGIWHKLFQFPLLESKTLLNDTALVSTPQFISFAPHLNYDISLYNTKPILHKLTHQNLYCNFWIIHLDTVSTPTIKWHDINNFALPQPLKKFVDNYKKTD